MWDYVAFFACNIALFLVAMLVWHIFPKPAPYDYTTIPGLKRDTAENETISDIRQTKSLSQFIRALHEDYGPLASFYWDDQYVISVSTSKLWYELIRKSKTDSSAITACILRVRSSCTKLPSLKLIAERYAKGQKFISNSNSEAERSWLTAASILHDKDFDWSDVQKLAAACQTIKSKYSATLLEGKFNQDLLVYADEEDITLETAIICNAIARCVALRSAYPLPDDTKQKVVSELQRLFTNEKFEWSKYKLLLSYITEIIRVAIPFEFVVCGIPSNINLDGYPIRQDMPFLLHLESIFGKHSGLDDHERVIPLRFTNGGKVTEEFITCMMTYPYFEILAASMLAVTYVDYSY